MRRLLFRTHIWLGWIVGGQLLLWMLSGLVMAAMPIGEVRGDHLRKPLPGTPLAGLAGLLPPEAILARTGDEADGLILRLLDGRPVYVLLEGTDPTALLDARTGAPIRLDAASAARLAAARHAGAARVTGVERIDPADPPLEFRREAPAFRVRFDDSERSSFYIHAVSGELLAVRTDRWRLFDLLWGLHIMDWRGREDFNHPLLVGAAALGLAGVAGGLALLLLRAARVRPRPRAARIRP
ncbi:MAG: hypothetical protein SNJ63_11150 [Sphingomonadaceae bacterium]